MVLKMSPALALAFLLSWISLSANADPQENGATDAIISDGKVDLDFRYRYEFVDQENFSKNANASTLRTRLGFKSGEYRGFDFRLEVNDVREIIWNDFNAAAGNTPNRTQYPVVADPKGTRLNEAYLGYNGLENWGFKLGRRRLNLDNQRFVGSVSWRQTEQVLDGFNVGWGNDSIDVTYTYVQWVRTIFGEEVSAGKDRQDGTHLLNASFKTPIGKAVGYVYQIDSERRAQTSTSTIGARLTGKQKVNDNWAFRYVAEFATQRDTGSNPADFSADYWNLYAGAVVGVFDFGVNWEVLTGNQNLTVFNEAFRTPLATLHAMNGWADLFLVTPRGGLDDKSVRLKATPGNFLIMARYHKFEAEDGGSNYGNEIDLRAGYKFNKRFRGDLFLAEFNGKNSFNDVTKIFVMATLAL